MVETAKVSTWYGGRPWTSSRVAGRQQRCILRAECLCVHPGGETWHDARQQQRRKNDSRKDHQRQLVFTNTSRGGDMGCQPHLRATGQKTNVPWQPQGDKGTWQNKCDNTDAQGREFATTLSYLSNCVYCTCLGSVHSCSPDCLEGVTAMFAPKAQATAPGPCALALPTDVEIDFF
eukprot:352433-Amphidinium_carterae.1